MKKIARECLALLLVAWFFQDLYFKVSNWKAYIGWMNDIPYLHMHANTWSWLIVGFEACLCFGLLFHSSRRIAALMTLGGLAVATLLIISALAFSHHLFFPFHALWAYPRWFHVLLTWLLVAWLTFILLRLTPMCNRKFK
jgi:hypothetical protein